MKTKLLFLVAFVMASVTYAQWTQLGVDIDGITTANNLGRNSVSLSSDGKTVAIGAPHHNSYPEHVDVYAYNSVTTS